MANTIFYICDGEEYSLELPDWWDTGLPRGHHSFVVLDLIARDLWDNYDGWEWMGGKSWKVEVYKDKDLKDLFVSGVIHTNIEPSFNVYIFNN